MGDLSFISSRVSKNGLSSAKEEPRRIRLRIEGLEDRVVPSYFPSTANGINIFEDQLQTGLSNAMIQFLATHTDGTQKELLQQTEEFRAINPNFTVLQYQLGTGNSPYDYIINNQWSSDWDTVSQQASWFVHQSDSGEPQSESDLASGLVGNNTGWVQADISNPAWQQYTLNQVLQNIAASGSNGWFADSFTYGIGGAGYDGTLPTRYEGTNAANPADWPVGSTWTTQLANWAQTIETAFAQYNAANGTDYLFIPNLDARITSWEPDWYDNANGMPFIDGAFLEGFGEATDTFDWTLSMNQGLNLADNGKIVIMQPYPSADPSTAAGQQQVNFFLGTYLLLKGDQTYLNIQYGDGAQYYPEYQLNLGAATTPLQSTVSGYLWDGVYRRDFQNGFVLVNPGNTTYTLNLGGTYKEVIASGGGVLTDADLDAAGNYVGGSMSYQNAHSITLTGGSAAIFMNANYSPLSVAIPAKASTDAIAGTSVNLDVLGQQNGSDTGLTYTWSSNGPADVTFSLTGSSNANRTTATFALAGTYTLTALISNGSQSVNSSVAVTVKQTTTALELSPVSTAVVDGTTQQFTATALDQFGDPLTKQPTFAWSMKSASTGTVNSKGFYTAPKTKIGAATVVVKSGTAIASATISIVPSGTANFVGADMIQQGNWELACGAEGYDIIGDDDNNPSIATVASQGASVKIWSKSTTDGRALSRPDGGRIAAALYSSKSFGLNINTDEDLTQQVSLYFLDWNKSDISERVDVVNSAGQIIDTRTVSSFSDGEYLVWNVSGNVTFRISRLSGPEAVLSGVFLGGPTE